MPTSFITPPIEGQLTRLDCKGKFVTPAGGRPARDFADEVLVKKQRGNFVA
jgi:hypothetical protein